MKKIKDRYIERNQQLKDENRQSFDETDGTSHIMSLGG